MKPRTLVPKEPTLKTVISLILDVRDELKAEIKAEMSGVRDELKGEINSVRSALKEVRDELKCEISGVRDELKGEIESVREVVEFIKDNAVTRDEFFALDLKVDRMKDELKEEMADFKSDIIDHVDHFVKLHKKQEVELVALAHRMNRHEAAAHP